MENFQALGNENEVVAQGNEAVDAKKQEKSKKLKEMSQLLKETINTDPTFQTKVRSLSERLSVVNTLGYGEGGNIIVDEATKNLPKDQRKLVTTSQIVGYRVANTGDQPIKYLTEEFTKNAEGVYEGQRVEKVMAAGEQVDFTRKYMTIFCAQPEISFQLSNGKIVRGSGSVKPGDIDGELEAHYFSFNDKNIKVNSDTMKLNVAAKKKAADGTAKWVVKPEFEKTFGYLNNAKATGKRGRGPSTTSKYTTQDMAANYINRLLQESGTV